MAQVVTLPAPKDTPSPQTAPIPAPLTLPDRFTLKPKEWVVGAVHQEVRKNAQGDSIKILDGQVEIEDSKILVRADHLEYNEETEEINATGNVYFHGFDKNEQIWCDHLQYNRETEKGAFFNVRGESAPRDVVRKGVLKGASPYHFEGQWAERLGNRYLLYNGWVTNCKIPDRGRPWWIMKGPKFDIIPHERAKAYRSWFILRKIPLFYTPYFYHSLEREPRHSGFLMPHIAPHTQRGAMVGLGYFWAINRSYDVTYQFLDYTANALGHHVDFRGNPRRGTDFDLIFYGVQDIGGDPNTHQTFSGANFYFLGKSDLGKGWQASAIGNAVTSFRFRQEWSGSYSESIGSEFHSSAFFDKSWSSFTFDTVLSRLENFQTAEVATPQPDGAINYQRNAVLIHKLPEAQFGGSDHQIFRDVPIWFSFYSAAGLLYRSEPFFDSTNTNRLGTFETSQFTPRLTFSPHITSALHLGPVDLVPSAGLDETFYGESQTPSAALGPGYYQAITQRITRSAQDFSLDLILPSLARVYQRKTIFGEKLKHVIEPRVTYKYVTGIGNEFGNYIRFDENDLLANTNEVTLSLTNRIYAKRKDGSVQEIFTWSLMQKRYFDPTFGGALLNAQPNIFAATSDLTAYAFLVGPRGYSPIVSLVRANPISGLGINWQADYDPRSHGLVDSSFSVDYRWKLYYGSVGNNEVHANPILMQYANQYSMRAGVGDQQHRGWNAGIEGVYDYRTGQLLHYTTQVTYNTNCCGFNVQYFRINIGQPHGVWAFAFSLANIGTFGSLKKNERWF